jgi:hypothetical protein
MLYVNSKTVRLLVARGVFCNLLYRDTSGLCAICGKLLLIVSGPRVCFIFLFFNVGGEGISTCRRCLGCLFDAQHAPSQDPDTRIPRTRP